MMIRHRLTYAASPTEVYEMQADPVFRTRVIQSEQWAALEAGSIEGMNTEQRVAAAWLEGERW